MPDFRVGKPPKPEEDKHALVLTGPAPQVGTRAIRQHAIRMRHLAPDVKDAISSGGVAAQSTSDGRVWTVGDLQVATHRQQAVSGQLTWTFPLEFAVAPRVTATGVHASAARSAVIVSVTATQAVIRLYDASGSTVTNDIEMQAIGVAA